MIPASAEPFKKWSRIARRLWGRYAQYRLVADRPLTSAERAFTRENHALWSRSLPTSPAMEPGGYVLVELHTTAYLTHFNMTLARLAVEAKGGRLLALTLPDRAVYPKEVLASYGDVELFQISSTRYAWYDLRAKRQARRLYRQLRHPNELLHLRLDGIEVGNLIYDDFLRRKERATLNGIDARILPFLEHYYLIRALARYLLARYPVRYAVTSHLTGVHPGVFMRYLLKEGIPVLACHDPRRPTLREYHDLSDVRIHALRPEGRYVAYGAEHEATWLAQKGAAYLKQRFNAELGDKNADKAFNSTHETFRSREAFAAAFGLDPSRKNVFVMLHAFTDHPHYRGPDSLLYQDYYHWFKETLRVARGNDTVNWIFKEHPAADFYPMRDLSLREVFEGVKAGHIRFIGHRANFNARSLQYLADAVVTCIGTAGLEYAAFGIPCLLCGSSSYSGFGFTCEPESRAAYEEALRCIEALPPLNEEQRQQAQRIAYLLFCVVQNPPFYFLPRPDYYAGKDAFKRFPTLNVDRNPHLVDTFWQDAADWLHEQDPQQVRHEVQKLLVFLKDERWSQYIDLDRHSYLRDAVGGSESNRSERLVDGSETASAIAHAAPRE